MADVESQSIPEQYVTASAEEEAALAKVRETASYKLNVIEAINQRDAVALLESLRQLRRFLLDLDKAEPNVREHKDSLHIRKDGDYWQKEIEKFFSDLEESERTNGQNRSFAILADGELHFDEVTRMNIVIRDGKIETLAPHGVSSQRAKDNWQRIEQACDIVKYFEDSMTRPGSSNVTDSLE